MATRKKTTSPKKARKAPRSKAKKPANAKAANAKAANTKTAKRSKKSPAAATSVDRLLKSFEQERQTLGSDLTAGRKKIETMTSKIAAMKADLEKTKRAVVETELAIETLDSRRDKEIGAVLHGLGVDLGKAASVAKVKPPEDKGTPLFDDEAKVEK